MIKMIKKMFYKETLTLPGRQMTMSEYVLRNETNPLARQAVLEYIENYRSKKAA